MYSVATRTAVRGRHRLRSKHRLRSGVMVVTVTAGLVAVPMGSSRLAGLSMAEIRLTSGDSPLAPLGEGTALVMGATGFSTPSQRWLDAVNTLYLQPHGFVVTNGSSSPIASSDPTDLGNSADPGGPADASNLQPLTTPELIAPFLPTAVYAQNQGAADVTAAVENAIAGKSPEELAANPVVVVGYSQSAGFARFAMEQLQAQGVPSSDVHFILLGDPANPNGGVFEFSQPSPYNILTPLVASPTPDNLYPTDEYMIEYDGAADFPAYQGNLLADANALWGIFWNHLTYLGLSPEQIASATAVPLADGSLTQYYVIPAQVLPILAPLTLSPGGQVLYDLLEPDMRILINLGYDNGGDLSQGWNDGPVQLSNLLDVLQAFPSNTNWSDVATALVQGWQQGVTAAAAALADPQTYLQSVTDGPALGPLLQEAYVGSFTNSPDPTSLWDLFFPTTGEPALSPEETVTSLNNALTSLDDAISGAFSHL
ncbi:MAG TPA: PE-PPE domain-containing protein [Mycobacterium sp.]|nr:PE-PPE domain-containing protein [Mycobacterium sp.]